MNAHNHDGHFFFLLLVLGQFATVGVKFHIALNLEADVRLRGEDIVNLRVIRDVPSEFRSQLKLLVRELFRIDHVLTSARNRCW